MRERTKEEISYTMSHIRSKDTSIEVRLRKALWKTGARFRKNVRGIVGTPDIAVKKKKVAVFCDSEFFHGYEWEKNKDRLKGNRDYWVKKIERNMERDKEVDEKLKKDGWTVLRFWGYEINKQTDGCVQKILEALGRA